MERRRKILVVDDERENREYLALLLEPQYQVFQAEGGRSAIALAGELAPDLVLLDLVMPDMDGLRVCEALRSAPATSHIPVVILTGADDPESRVRVFRRGADDYISRPFRSEELFARIASKVRRITEREGAEGPACGNLSLNQDALEARIEGTPISLSLLEFRLLSFFVSNIGKVMSREKILETVWKDAVVTDRTVDTHMVSLRKKLGSFDYCFSTVYGAGYVLKARPRPASPEPACPASLAQNEMARVEATPLRDGI